VKKFWVKLLVFGLVFLALVASIIVLSPLPSNAYHFAILDKHRFLEAAGSPKLVLAGGSNCAFGIDSAVLSKAFHTPVVNLGIDAGFGLGRILDDASPFLGDGDILLIIPEYSHYTNNWNGNSDAYEMIFDARQYRLALHPGWYGLPGAFPAYLSIHLQAFVARYRPPNPLAHRRDGFNEYGDYVGHLETGNRYFRLAEAIGPLDRNALKQFFHIMEEFQARGIRILFSYPSYEAESFDRSQGLIAELDGLLRENEHIQVISRPEDYRFPRDLFYDSVYHLNAEGRRLRTETLRRDLERSGVF
jgi:hypothetical protein